MTTEPEVYGITDDQFREIHSALMTAALFFALRKRNLRSVLFSSSAIVHTLMSVWRRGGERGGGGV